MTRRSILLVTTALMIMALGACGAATEAGQTPSAGVSAASASDGLGGDADTLMARAKTLAKKTYDLEGQLWEGHIMAALTAPDAAAAKPELAKARALVAQMRANEQSIIAILGQVAQLGPGEELTSYAGQQKEIAKLRLLSMAGTQKLLAKIEARYQEKGRLAQSDIDKLFAESEPSDPADPSRRLEEKGLASLEYFKQSGLPQRYSINNGFGEAFGTEEQAGAFPLADGITFEGPMVAEEEAPRELQGSFGTSVADAMQAQRSALESEGWSVSVGSSGETRGVMTAQNSYWKATLTFERDGGAGEGGTVVVRMTQL